MKKLLCILLMLWVTPIFSQQMILVEKENSVKRNRYIKGAEITFSFKRNNPQSLIEEERYVEGVITKISDDSLKVGTVKVAYSEISKVWKPNEKTRLPNFFKKVFRTAGRVYFIISAINGLANNDSPIIHPSATIGLLGGEALGFLFAKVPARFYNLESGKWKIRVVDFSATEQKE
ncbi:hypothetical protein [Luteibaculum oceani]|uniref:Uncharacterized protein n=1 Tax=Luteibaculum oceani TaxID=1294296 RepID=A0A5C6V9C5_9FLAO|nr:hypothetical protein [Luteibaculum oceani]TXC81779.1 hypothetical protein FRX97_04480 [Luteibaculum oceani]